MSLDQSSALLASTDQQGIDAGRKEGLLRGRRSGALAAAMVMLLERRGPLPPDLQSQFESLPESSIRPLIGLVCRCGTFGEVRDFLKSHREEVAPASDVRSLSPGDPRRQWLDAEEPPEHESDGFLDRQLFKLAFLLSYQSSLKEGMQQGSRAAAAMALEERFGELPIDIASAVDSWPVAKLGGLVRNAVRIERLADLPIPEAPSS